MRKFLCALSFLTIFPQKEEFKGEDIAESRPFFPIVGLCIGIFLSIFYLLLKRVVPEFTTSILTLALLAFLTKGFHLDGLCDTFDALGVFSKEDRQKIMKDEKIGVFGLLSLIFLICCEISSLHALKRDIYRVLITFPVVGRVAILQMAYLAKDFYYKEGMGYLFIKDFKDEDFFIGVLYSAVIVLLAAGFSGILAFLLTGFFVYLLSVFWKRAFLGITGDVLGATLELSQLFYLIVLSCFA